MENEMSAQDVAETLGALAKRRAETDGSTLSGAQVGVQPGACGGRFARMMVVLPNGQTFAVQVEEI